MSVVGSPTPRDELGNPMGFVNGCDELGNPMGFVNGCDELGNPMGFVNGCACGLTLLATLFTLAPTGVLAKV